MPPMPPYRRHREAYRRLGFSSVLRYHCFGGDQESLNQGCIRDRHANDLGRVDKLAREIQSCGSLVFGGPHYVPNRAPLILH